MQERGLVENEIEIMSLECVMSILKLARPTYGSSPGEWSVKMEWQYPDPNEDCGQDSGQVKEMPGGWIED